jgi:hypothetical protein
MNDHIANDEIDLKQLIRAVLDTKIWVFILLIVVSAGYWTLQVLSNLSKPTVYTYQTRINLVFTGVNEGNYPNGSPYNNNDLISPAVLNSVFDSNSMSEFIDRKSFISAFSVQPYTPDRDLILKKYSTQLTGNLTGAEAGILQGQMSEELRKAAADAVTLTFSSTRASQVPSTLLNKVLRDVPVEWARHMVDEIGVTNYDAKIYTENVIDKSLFESIDYLIAFEMLLDRIELLQNNIRVIKQIPNGNVASDDISGMAVPDLEKAVLDVQRYRIAPLINPVRSLGIAKDSQLVKLYFENELVELNRSIEVLKDKKINIQDTYENYIRYQSGSLSVSGGNLANPGQTQISTGLFDKIVELASASTDIEYRQELSANLLDVSNKIADAKSEILRIDEILQAMSGANSSTQTLRESYTKRVNIEMPLIIEQLREYFLVSTRLYEKLSIEALGGSSTMFRMADGQVVSSQSGNILTTANIRLYIIVCFLLIVVAVPVLMIWNALRND